MAATIGAMSRSQQPYRRPGPFSVRVLAAIAGLTLLFSVLAPAASQPLGFSARLLFWFLHIALGLGAALLAARAMVVTLAVPRDWRLILFSGVAGVVLFAPVAYLLESLFPIPPETADADWGDRLADGGMPLALLLEAAELAPSFLAAWFLVNLEPLTRVFRPDETVEGDGNDAPRTRADDPRRSFLERLPAAIGQEIVCVSSDLHYLQVRTTQGQAMILGSLQEVEDAFGAAGLRVHRSHWVATDRVLRLRQRGTQWFAEMQGGHTVPVSRRRRSDVTARLGRDFRRNPDAGTSPPV